MKYPASASGFAYTAPYRFLSKVGDGEIIATSENYTPKASAKNGIESVRDNAKAVTLEDTTGE